MREREREKEAEGEKKVKNERNRLEMVCPSEKESFVSVSPQMIPVEKISTRTANSFSGAEQVT